MPTQYLPGQQMFLPENNIYINTKYTNSQRYINWLCYTVLCYVLLSVLCCVVLCCVVICLLFVSLVCLLKISQFSCTLTQLLEGRTTVQSA